MYSDPGGAGRRGGEGRLGCGCTRNYESYEVNDILPCRLLRRCPFSNEGVAFQTRHETCNEKVLASCNSRWVFSMVNMTDWQLLAIMNWQLATSGKPAEGYVMTIGLPAIIQITLCLRLVTT